MEFNVPNETVVSNNLTLRKQNRIRYKRTTIMKGYVDDIFPKYQTQPLFF